MKNELIGLLRPFVYAGTGIRQLFRNERNTRIHLALTILAILLALCLNLNAVEWAILALTIGIVFATEALNTAVEAAVDLASPDHHPLAKIAKDTAAGAVLITAIMAVVVAAFLFIPKL